jgi:hypothetical protein
LGNIAFVLRARNGIKQAPDLRFLVKRSFITDRQSKVMSAIEKFDFHNNADTPQMLELLER